MKNEKIYGILSLITSILLVHPGYATDRERSSLIIEKTKESHEGAGKRVKKRAEGRKLQDQGKALEENMERASKPMSYAGTVVSLGAAASGDPHAKMAAAAFRLAIIALEEGGKGIAQIVQIVGRYKERSQEILSNAEIFLEEAQKSQDKIKNLEKKRKELLKVEKPLGPSESSSRLKQLAKGAQSAVKTAEIKVRQATDVITDAKADREKKLEVIQADLKVENEKYAEYIRLLEILLVQDAIKEAKKKIDIEGTIETLESRIKLYQAARVNLSSKSKSKQKKGIAEIEKEEAIINNELVYYLKFQKSPTETAEQLGKYLSQLQDTKDELTALTKQGDILYLQQKEVDLDSNVNREAIVGLYREIDAIKSQLEKLDKTAPMKNTEPPGPKQSLEPSKSQKDITPKIPLETTKDKGNSGFSREVIIKQKENLRSLTVPSTGAVNKSGG